MSATINQRTEVPVKGIESQVGPIVIIVKTPAEDDVTWTLMMTKVMITVVDEVVKVMI